ncbi:WbqC family protein [Paenibacillus ferrarius]|uniref:WbqC family protein n=1 Tax=Paenibacillus ferrarius TaxID=1469647 RepID=UPI003D2844E9
MILTAHQPAYLPWLGYLEKIKNSDIYVYLDSVQFETRSFINRNKIKTPNGGIWLSVPVKSKGHREIPLNQLEIDTSIDWKTAHLKAIYLNYKKAPKFNECYSKLESLYSTEHTYLSDLCYNQLLFWFKEFNITTRIVKSSELNIKSKKSDLILDLCKHYNSDVYISGTLGRDYIEISKFQEFGIEVIFQNYLHPVYPQLWGSFIPYMSVLDFWMNNDDYELIWRKE